MPEPPPRSRLPERHRVDLRKSLSARARWALGLLVAGCVSLLAWWQGHDRAVPAWITDWLVPALGWGWLACAAVALAAWWPWRRAKPRNPADQGDRR